MQSDAKRGECGSWKCNQGRGAACETCDQRPALLSVWRRSFIAPTNATFFHENQPAVINDLKAVRDILDESKAFVLPLEPIEAAPPPRREDDPIGTACMLIAGALLGLLAWAALSTPAWL